MITRPVAVARSLIVLGLGWALGGLLVAAAFSALGASSTIQLGDGVSRVQVIWLGAHAFVTCVAALLGVSLGASALTRSGAAAPAGAVSLVGGLTLAVAALACLGLGELTDLRPVTVWAMLVGAGIGAAGAFFFVAQSGDPDRGLGYGRPAAAARRSWTSR